MPSNCDFSGQLNEIKDLIGSSPPPDTSALESRLSELESRLGALDGQLPILQAGIDLQNSRYDQIAVTVAGLAGTAAAALALANTSEALARQAQAQALQAIGVGGQAINMAGNAQNAAQQALAGARNALGQAASNAGKIAGLVGKVAGIAAAIAGVAGLALAARNAADIRDLQRGLEDSQANDRQHARDIAGLNKRADSLNDKIGQVQKALEKQISNLGAQFAAALQGLREQVAQADRALASRISDIWDYLRGLGLGSVGTATGGVTDRINDLARDLGNVGAKVGALGGTIGALGSDVTNLKGKVGAMGNDLQGLWGRTGDLSRDLTGLRTQSRLNAQQIAGILGTLAALGVAVAALQARKLMCRYNDAQVGQIAATTATIATTTAALQSILNSVLIPFTSTATKSLEFLSKTATATETAVTNLATASGNFFKSAVIERAWNALTLLVVLHNAAMLSRNIIETLGDTLSTGLDLIGIRDEENERIDINQILGKSADNFMRSLLGAEVWANTKQSWALASRTISAAANITSTMRSIFDSSLEVGLWTAEQVAKIGNGLKADGVVERFRWPDMPESVPRGSALLNSLEGLDDAASSLNMVVSEVKSVQDEAKELVEQRDEFKKALADQQQGFDRLRESVDNDSDPGDITPII